MSDSAGILKFVSALRDGEPGLERVLLKLTLTGRVPRRDFHLISEALASLEPLLQHYDADLTDLVAEHDKTELAGLMDGALGRVATPSTERSRRAGIRPTARRLFRDVIAAAGLKPLSTAIATAVIGNALWVGLAYGIAGLSARYCPADGLMNFAVCSRDLPANVIYGTWRHYLIYALMFAPAHLIARVAMTRIWPARTA